MCLFNESKLYIENAQKEHNRAFFVCTLWMWASIPALDLSGGMSQLPHLYSTVCPPETNMNGLFNNWLIQFGFNCAQIHRLLLLLLLNRGWSWGGCGVGLDILKKLRQFPHTHLCTRLLECHPPLCHQLVASGYYTNCCKLQKYMYFNIFDVFDMRTIYWITFHTLYLRRRRHEKYSIYFI